MSLPYYYILRPNYIIIDPIDGLTPQAARPSADTVLYTQTGSFAFGSKFTDLTT